MLLYALDHAEDFVLAHDDVLHAVDLDLGAGVLAEQDPVARLDVELDQRAVLEALAGADGDDLALERPLLGGVGDDDAAPGLLVLLDAADQDAILQGTDVHGFSSWFQVLGLQRQVLGGWRTLLALTSSDC